MKDKYPVVLGMHRPLKVEYYVYTDDTGNKVYCGDDPAPAFDLYNRNLVSHSLEKIIRYPKNFCLICEWQETKKRWVIVGADCNE